MNPIFNWRWRSLTLCTCFLCTDMWHFIFIISLENSFIGCIIFEVLFISLCNSWFDLVRAEAAPFEQEQELFLILLERWAERVTVWLCLFSLSAVTYLQDTVCKTLERRLRHSHRHSGMRLDQRDLRCKERTFHWSLETKSQGLSSLCFLALYIISALICLSAWPKSCTSNEPCVTQCKNISMNTPFHVLNMNESVTDVSRGVCLAGFG